MFFKHKFVARKCACREALGFKVAPMLRFIDVMDVEIKGDVLRSFIRRTGIGCNGVKLRFVRDGPQHHGTHIRRSALPTDLLAWTVVCTYRSTGRKAYNTNCLLVN